MSCTPTICGIKDLMKMHHRGKFHPYSKGSIKIEKQCFRNLLKIQCVY